MHGAPGGTGHGLRPSKGMALTEMVIMSITISKPTRMLIRIFFINQLLSFLRFGFLYANCEGFLVSWHRRLSRFFTEKFGNRVDVIEICVNNLFIKPLQGLFSVRNRKLILVLSKKGVALTKATPELLRVCSHPSPLIFMLSFDTFGHRHCAYSSWSMLPF